MFVCLFFLACLLSFVHNMSEMQGCYCVTLEVHFTHMQCGDVYVLHVVWVLWVLWVLLVLLMASSLASNLPWGLLVCSLGNCIGVVRACLIR
jgi:hypothetical protein